jgi:4-hydroxy-tetrahydrodipicolinate reductase
MAIKVLVSGSGKMGREVLSAVVREPDMDPVGCVDLLTTEEYVSVPGSDLIPFGSDPAAMIARVRPDVIVDFTNAEFTPRLAREAIGAGVRLVVGTSGLTPELLRELEAESRKKEIGVVVAPNFALGAVLMEYMARVASRFFSHAEIVEMHHENKVDAPSGTSLATARAMADERREPFHVPTTERETLKGTRGGQHAGISIHSVRLPGLVAHQQVIFGSEGETLTIRHDTSDRVSFMPGVILAIREVMNRKDFVFGLERLIGLT